ncbi:LysE family translocator [Sunxiuqinia sp. A32]|uniref:LysE family translocator n=1 Tax=Sunxiuqinia sp. A32 TaxID=3461496 RepID=UPI0040454B0F
MFLSLFIEGFIVGFAVSVPIGPIGVLVLQRTVNKNRLSGFFSGIGAATSDTIYAVIAGFSLSYVINFIKQYQFTFQLVGTLMLLILGIFIFTKNPVKDLRNYRRKGSSHFQDMMSTFLVTFTNPLVALVFLAVFTGSGIVLDIAKPYQALFMLSGVFLGANFWWFILTSLADLFKHKFNLRVLWWFNKIAGAMVLVFVLVSLIITLTSHFMN